MGGLAWPSQAAKVTCWWRQPYQKICRSRSKRTTGGGGVRLHKFVVIDLTSRPRGYMGSFNFSGVADTSNGENLLLIKNRRIATSYMIEAVRIFDHYEFRVAQTNATKARAKLQLQKPPRNPGEKAWFDEDYTNPRKITDRELFS